MFSDFIGHYILASHGGKSTFETRGLGQRVSVEPGLENNSASVELRFSKEN